MVGIMGTKIAADTAIFFIVFINTTKAVLIKLIIIIQKRVTKIIDFFTNSEQLIVLSEALSS